MEFLKSVLGDELYNQFSEKLNAHNGNEANKDNQIKIANLSGGEYVGKGKYDALQALLNGKTTELDTANGLIAELKKGTKGNEELQGKITGYESQVEQLQRELEQTKINSAIQIALLSEKVEDVPYLTYKLNENLRKDGKNIELDENGSIKGWNDMLSGLKTQFPKQFQSGSGDDGYQVVEPLKLQRGDGNDKKITAEEFNKMGYKARVEFKQSNPEQYTQLMKG